MHAIALSSTTNESTMQGKPLLKCRLQSHNDSPLQTYKQQPLQKQPQQRHYPSMALQSDDSRCCSNSSNGTILPHTSTNYGGTNETRLDLMTLQPSTRLTSYALPRRTKEQEQNLLYAIKLELPPVYPQTGDVLDMSFYDFKVYLEKLAVYLGRGTTTFGMNSGYRKASSFKLQCRLKDKCKFLLHSRELLPDKQTICLCEPHSCSPAEHNHFSILSQGFLAQYLLRDEVAPSTITAEGKEVQKFIAHVSDKLGVDFRARGRREMVSRYLHEKIEQTGMELDASDNSSPLSISMSPTTAITQKSEPNHNSHHHPLSLPYPTLSSG
jgi:hypothetical protein